MQRQASGIRIEISLNRGLGLRRELAEAGSELSERVAEQARTNTFSPVYDPSDLVHVVSTTEQTDEVIKVGAARSNEGMITSVRQ